MWIWIVVALIIIAGLFFWMKSGKKDEGADISSTSEDFETPQEPEVSAPTEMSSETPEDETPETPEDSSEEDSI